MSKRVSFQHSRRPSLSRVRGAVVAAGLGTSMVLGAGAAFAAATAGSPGVASLINNSAAESVAQQAAMQGKAAKVAKAAEVAKVAKEKAAKKAAAKKAAGWETPVSRYQLSASFGNDGSRWAHKHSGQDFAVPIGTKVKAVHGGTVVKAGPNGGGDGPAYGNAVVIKHANGTYSQYAHLAQIDVRIGETVKTGQKIALSGNTGNSSGPHLHFEIRHTADYGSAVNPVSFLHKEGVSV
ncbi:MULTISPECIES: M23 family metallopeptidase [unclassified Streptomyces]|uniref:M23 family metallopeptidase n=1 Tax=unclassified Streptomyces TaxID=2593676 RepID=UPI002255CA59|nr:MULTISPECIES: M23 family metallopeptidase [unclassified Streptomyces]WSP55832.1 M23 family metallopeptidase [Streptomyces sp. NBC_01241]MCX4787542.1 M23 family metallopeptidase [Streptomyces sp. NBC_01221]MCX4796673.1 M23 family metallopeptidase [Streptomyces sp. NBC_01242]WSJ37901.1 M23 family metallopeptidase [Streptomyces sp. NBC_01321]WSP64303.1 M23 family metallopeptidase [Streptomyces sp. NBC_01240]